MKVLKNQTGLISFNTEYKTVSLTMPSPEKISQSIIWFSHAKPVKNMLPIDCFVYSVLDEEHEFNDFTFVIKDEPDISNFNKLLFAERALYNILYNYGNYFTKEELLLLDEDENKDNKHLKNELPDSFTTIVPDFDRTDLYVWMLIQCKIYLKQLDPITGEITWITNMTIRDALIQKYQYYKLTDLIVSFDNTILHECKKYINKYKNKIEKAHSYLLGRLNLLYINNLESPDAIDLKRRIDLFLDEANSKLTELIKIIYSLNPTLPQDLTSKSSKLQ